MYIAAIFILSFSHLYIFSLEVYVLISISLENWFLKGTVTILIVNSALQQSSSGPAVRLKQVQL